MKPGIFHTCTLLLSVLLTMPSGGQDLEYTVIDLGTLGGDASAALGINDRGQVVGWAMDSAARRQAFTWQNGTMTGLGFLPGGTNSTATSVNNAGQITGYGAVSGTNRHAFLYSSNSLVDIGSLGGYNSWGYSINESGVIAGSSLFTNANPNITDPHGFVWGTNGFTRIRPYHTFLQCDAFGVNNEGRVCGTTFLWGSSYRWWAYVWHDSNSNGVDEELEMEVLGSLGSTNWMDYTTSGARAINDAGQVVGYTSVTPANFPQHAFIVTPLNGEWKTPPDDLPPANARMQSLGTLGPFTNNSYAHAINNQSWVVGTATSLSGTNQAFLWRNGVMTNLNDLIAVNTGWVLTNATGINENYEIVGSGVHNGQERAFLLTRDGRMTHMDPVTQLELIGVFTNELDEVWTQTIDRVESISMQWAGLWGTNAITSRVFAVEYTDDPLSDTWLPYEPTGQWSIMDNIWTITNVDPAVTTRLFRVRAE